MIDFGIPREERLNKALEHQEELLTEHLDSLEDTIIFLREDIRDFRAKLIQFEDLRSTLKKVSSPTA